MRGVTAVPNNRRAEGSQITPIVDLATQQFLLDRIREINDRRELACFRLEKIGISSPYRLGISAIKMQDAMNALEAAGKVHVYWHRGDRQLLVTINRDSSDDVTDRLPIWPETESESEKNAE
jgi:hypothetical protein